MKRIIYIILLAMVVAIVPGCNINRSSTASKVELKKNESGYHRLFVNNEEFYVEGAGLEFGNIEALAEYGGNSFRTWRSRNESEDALEVLDRAHENGLMVLMGLDVARERHGFDYSDKMKVKEQFDFLKGEVERLKDHPALLGWAIGNELELEAPKNPGAYRLFVYATDEGNRSATANIPFFIEE